MLASYARKGVENPVPRRWKWPVLRWPQMAGFGVAAEAEISSNALLVIK
jgi:hypothetical protein